MKHYEPPAVIATVQLLINVCGVRPGGLTERDRRVLLEHMVFVVADGRREERDPDLKAKREQARANLARLRAACGIEEARRG